MQVANKNQTSFGMRTRYLVKGKAEDLNKILGFTLHGPGKITQEKRIFSVADSTMFWPQENKMMISDFKRACKENNVKYVRSFFTKVLRFFDRSL